MMIPGYQNESVEAASLEYKIAMRESGEERDGDFEQLLGESQYVAPITTHKTYVMFKGVTDILPN